MPIPKFNGGGKCDSISATQQLRVAESDANPDSVITLELVQGDLQNLVNGEPFRRVVLQTHLSDSQHALPQWQATAVE